MRKPLIMGTKTDVIKRRAKAMGMSVIDVVIHDAPDLNDFIGYPQAVVNRSIVINHAYKKIVTLTHL